MIFFGNNKAVVQYVENTLEHLNADSRLIMTITQVKSEGFCVTTVIRKSSDDTDNPMKQS